MTLVHDTEDWAGQRAALINDPHRPVYHFLPPRYWMNDPNGLIQWQGTYHLFYQHNPHGPLWGGIHWGHATSEDLVHWTDQPIVLAPTPDGPDEEGCWSGCAVVHEGVPTFLYTGLREGQPGMLVARSRDDNLLAWEKDPRNPVIPAPPEELEVVGFRDHSAWREGEWWYQVIGSGIKGVGGTALLYRSQDLITWEYLHPLLVGDEAAREPLWTGTMWECPDFFALDGKHVLLISVWNEHKLHYSAYMVGTYVDHRFIPETVRKLDFGDNHFYAPQTLLDDQGRRLVWGWIQEGRTPLRQSEAGWSGVMSLPRQLSFGDGGLLYVEPVPELQMLRRNHRRFEDLDVTPGQGNVLAGLRGDTLELMAEWEVGDAAQVGFKVRCAPDGSEETLIFYDAVARCLVVDGERSSLDTQTVRQQHRGKVNIQDNLLRLHIFLDRSVIEVFTGGSGCVTSRVYPTHADSVGINLFTIGGSARLVALDVWELTSIWLDDAWSLAVPTGSHREGKP